MKIVPFPRRGNVRDDTLVSELEAALSGEAGGGAEAESWRELRADVRALAPPMSLELERELWDRIQACSETERESLHPRPMAHAALVRLRGWSWPGARRRLIALAGACAVIAVIALAITAPRHSAETSSSSSAVSNRASELAPVVAPAKATEHAGAGTSDSSAAAAVTEAESSQITPFAKSVGPQGGRVQQRGASITLAPKPEAVQSVADAVAQLAARDGGFVQSSHVSLQHGASGEANLQLSLPSVRLSTALAELARLAPARTESQSLQDITDEYDADRTKLADAVAERQALLRALAKASTQGQIESLHARLALAASAITRARSAYAAVSKRGSNSSVEVTVLGDAHAGSSESTLSKALHDAGDVLKGALAVLIVALAVLVPLAILLVLLALGWRMTRRRLRERVLS